MHTYPHTIENGEGEVLTFLGVVHDRDGDRMELELLAPMHLHPRDISWKVGQVQGRTRAGHGNIAGAPHSTRAV